MIERAGYAEMKSVAVAHLFLILLLLSKRRVTVLAGVTAVIVFGDSSVDAGNNNAIPTIARSNFPPYGRDFAGGKPTGRFCNGRLATDFISQYFGLKPIVPAYLDPAFSIADFATGVTFASAATGFDNVTAGVLSVIPLWRQLEYYMEFQNKLRNYRGGPLADVLLSEALYVISLGTNDFIENYYAIPTRSAHFTISQYQDFVAGIARDFVVELYQLGARKIDLSGLSPIGCVPISRAGNVVGGGDCREDYNKVAIGFNARLQAIATQLNANLPGARIVYAHVYDIVLDIVNHPQHYGYENERLGCCATGLYEMGYVCKPDHLLTCPDASKYVFWDAVHPTEKTYSIVANYLMRTALAQFLP